jgi:hypothetical protein
MGHFNRTLEELRQHAVLHWPDEILAAAEEVGTLPLLLKTQDSFLSILKVASKEPLSWKIAVDNSSQLSGSLFLKHLMVLSDLGGEALNKLPPLNNYIQGGKLSFDWNGNPYHYQLKEIGSQCSLTNTALNVDAKKLVKGLDLNDRGIDVCMLLLFGSLLTNDTLPSEVKEKCVLGEYLGKTDELDKFIKQRYLFVSKQVSGATANSLGQIAQTYVADNLKLSLGAGWSVKLNGSLPGVFHNIEGNGTNFDIVVMSPNGKHFGLEISFQVTTNSTIERKARESESVMKSVHSKGHKICYVIDGAGNINVRKNAVSILCNHSDCTVAMSDSEIKHLANYFKSTLNEKT